MLDRTSLDQENVWKIVGQIRKSFLFQLKAPKCIDGDTLISDSYIKNNIDVVEQKLKLNKETNPNKNITDETL